MNIKLHSLSFAATVALVVALAFGSSLWAQSNSDAAAPQTQQQAPPTAQGSPDAQEPPSQQPGQSSPDQAQPQAQPTDSNRGSDELVGTILKKGDKYVFQDAASGNTYDIDHQDEVKKFEGKKVRVHGTVDPKSNIIHVQ
jgi:uncharacterized protein YdeI (BOF family)